MNEYITIQEIKLQIQTLTNEDAEEVVARLAKESHERGDSLTDAFYRYKNRVTKGIAMPSYIREQLYDRL